MNAIPGNCRIDLIPSALALLLSSVTVTALAPQSVPLQSLTVPAVALPANCVLAPPPSAPSSTPVGQGGRSLAGLWPGYPTNPWTGTDRQLLATIHSAIDPTRTKPLPDVPPGVSPRAGNGTNLADNIIEGYHAAYTATAGDGVEVFAVTFNNVALAGAPERVAAILNPPQGATQRLVRGSTVLRVSAANSSECFRAILSHIESVK